MKFDINILFDLKTLGNKEALNDIFESFEIAIAKNEKIYLISTDIDTKEDIPMGFIETTLDLIKYKTNFLND